MQKYINNFWNNNKRFVLFIFLMLVFRSAVADWNDVPTGSMKPTIVEGDRIFINKLAYDIQLPFMQYSLFKLSDPQTNDIIIFESAVAQKRLVKRVIGVPGDTIEMINNRLFINNKAIDYQHNKQDENLGFRILKEQLTDVSHKIQITQQDEGYGNFSPVVVPNDHYLVLGDNRNQSADSRMIGFIPRNEIIGRTNRVAFSLDYENYYLPRLTRFFKRI
ncbi:signal peptidase I [Thalassotalea sp. 1_MG-2023]|uniref:signal peptidase I n=1 Tax=Thalassotalea sp. 1_MG-2023 TaxID=3062680 RepID=UPI0026E3DA0A|nr:signal peptidase I [Thalassotalea sp. 1_MG-2023]MDO6427836.1 signal peptidase I [Thalassotalea sp. 1_MG-2023]